MILGPNEIPEAVRSALQNRDYRAFADLFDASGIYELPYALKGRPNRYEGREQIYNYIAAGMANANKSFSVQEVTVNIHPCTEENVVFAEFFLTGMPSGKSESFTIASSAALITCKNGRITLYRDFPNSAGIAQAADNLSAYIKMLNGIDQQT